MYPGLVKTQVVEQVLKSEGETGDVFREITNRGQYASPIETARFIAKLICDAPDELLDSQDSWDYNNEADRRQIETLVERIA